MHYVNRQDYDRQSMRQRLIEVSKVIERERNSAKTGMNDASSRSHAVIELRMYRKTGDDFRVNCFRTLDLAGSERYGKKDS